MKILKLTIGAFVALTLSPVVGTAAQPASRSLVVQHGDLDLSTPTDQERFDARLRTAIRIVCGDASPADLRSTNETSACRANLRASMADQRASLFAQAPSRTARMVAASR